MHFDFKTFWDSEYTAAQQSRAEAMVRGLMAIGYTELAAQITVEAFQQQAFEDGEMEEKFNSCGEDA